MILKFIIIIFHWFTIAYGTLSTLNTIFIISCLGISSKIINNF